MVHPKVKTTKKKISAAPVDREKNSPDHGAAVFFITCLSGLRTPLGFFDNNYYVIL